MAGGPWQLAPSALEWVISWKEVQMSYAPQFFPAPVEVETGYSGIVVYTANGKFADQSPSFSVMMVL